MDKNLFFHLFIRFCAVFVVYSFIVNSLILVIAFFSPDVVIEAGYDSNDIKTTILEVCIYGVLLKYAIPFFKRSKEETPTEKKESHKKLSNAEARIALELLKDPQYEKNVMVILDNFITESMEEYTDHKKHHTLLPNDFIREQGIKDDELSEYEYLMNFEFDGFEYDYILSSMKFKILEQRISIDDPKAIPKMANIFMDFYRVVVGLRIMHIRKDPTYKILMEELKDQIDNMVIEKHYIEEDK